MDKCREEVTRTGFSWMPCSRKATKDGWCWQHHPDAVAKRKAKAAEIFQREQKNSPWRRLDKANQKIEFLNREIESLCKKIVEKDNEIDRLRREADELEALLQEQD